ncbi:MAG: prepilin-type N-terminal cleavage/methylation domain-containing protein [Micrococcales bacterium]|nr:prepilin-type N-terminal cleavage/methylation domain-containing protein [Micrococcales bacterium]
MDRIRKGEKNDVGFTLIELLVVIIIIGILAAIAIPVFLNQRQSAWKTQVVSDVRQATLAVETYGTANNGSFVGLVGSEAHTAGDDDSTKKLTFTVTTGDTITVAVAAASPTKYTVTGTNANLGTGAGNTYTYDSTKGTGSWG